MALYRVLQKGFTKDNDLVFPDMVIDVTPKYKKGKVPSWLEEVPADAKVSATPLPPRHADTELAKKGVQPTSQGEKLDEGSTGVERFD
ncbi:hypothetical protein [Thiolapillus sp.]|uniref:hypothetical protein n=1 Tax=Thiolapillus sp. TaxID=2017437 RepID=UPI003AF53FFD